MQRRDFLRNVAALGAATALWVPASHTFFRPGDALRDGLAERHLRLWEEPGRWQHELEQMRLSNPEWDFMGRTFVVLALADLALEHPERKARHLAVIDAILTDTLDVVGRKGDLHFLLGYAMVGRWRNRNRRSLFIEGELALMLGARRFLQDDGRWDAEHRRRVARTAALMEDGPVLSGESYPDECWTFCNTVGLAAITMADALEGTASTLPRRWVANAREHLTDTTSKMLVSSYHHDGRHRDGPEGSTIWLSATMLKLVDEPYAADQYARARTSLGRTLCGYGWGREWPANWVGPTDIDSGPIVPIVEASAGSSGHAVIAARAFGDQQFHDALLASLGFAAFPVHDGDVAAFAAGNQVGDAVLLFGLTVGPLFDAVRRTLT